MSTPNMEIMSYGVNFRVTHLFLKMAFSMNLFMKKIIEYGKKEDAYTCLFWIN